MGVNRIAGTFGCTMEPPAATEYAVLPVGVASITPSACTWTCATHCRTHHTNQAKPSAGDWGGVARPADYAERICGGSAKAFD